MDSKSYLGAKMLISAKTEGVEYQREFPGVGHATKKIVEKDCLPRR